MSRSVESGHAVVCRSCQTLDPRMPERALASSVGASCIAISRLRAALAAGPFNAELVRFEVSSCLTARSPDRFALNPFKARANLAGSRPLVVSRGRACKSSSRLRELRPPWVSVLRCHRTSARPKNYKALLRQVHLGSLRFCAILVASCEPVPHTMASHERCRVAPVAWFHRSMPAGSRQSASAETRV